MNKCFLISLFVALLGVGCVPFDSNKHNKKLIQSTWYQVQISYPNQEGNALISEQLEGSTSLTFFADSCFEKMKDLDTTIHYVYDIKDYVLKLEKDSSNISYLGIHKLTNDSLVLQANDRLWKYIKKAD